jgi:hypothetical protein
VLNETLELRVGERTTTWRFESTLSGRPILFTESHRANPKRIKQIAVFGFIVSSPQGGTISVESEVGKGSRFIIVLPLVTTEVNV